MDRASARGDVDVVEAVRGAIAATLDPALADPAVANVSGLSVAVVRGGEVVAEVARGTCPATGARIGVDTGFQVGSTSKFVAAVAVLSLVGDGRLDLHGDDDADLARWSLPPGRQSTEHPVTVAGLLSHTAGCTVHGFLGYGPDEPVPTIVDVLDGRGNSDPVRVTSTPGSAFEYSGGGYCILQLLLDELHGSESMSGFARAVHDRVLDPAGCTRSGYGTPDRGDCPDRGPTPDSTICAISAGSIEGVAMAERWRTFPELAAAGLWSTAGDVARVFAAVGAALCDEPGAVLPRDVAHLLVTPVRLADGERVANGLGAVLDDAGRPTSFSHGGRNLGYCSENRWSIDGRDGVVVLTNDFPHGRPLARTLIDDVERRLGGVA